MSLQIDFTLSAPSQLLVQFEETTTLQSFKLFATDTSYDSLYETAAHVGLVTRCNEAWSLARWHTDQQDYALWFSIKGELVTIYVSDLDSPDQHVWPDYYFAASGTHDDIIIPFWRAFSSLEANNHFSTMWQHPFPSDTLKRVIEYMQNHHPAVFKAAKTIQ